MKNKIKQEILAHQESCPDHEVCGFIVIDEGKLVTLPTKNYSKNKDFFIADSKEYLKVKIAHEVCGVYHTHVSGTEDPSDFDIISADHICLPFLIYSTISDKFSLIIPEYVECAEESVLKLEEWFND